MYLGENNGNLRETKYYLFSTLSQNKKIFDWYDERFSHNE